MRIIFLFFLVLMLNSCFLFKQYKTKDFTYTANGQSQRLSFVVPKKFTQEKVTDTAGIHLHTFRYADGAMLYAAYLTDTMYEIQPFNKLIHQPKPIGPNGGLSYKGEDSTQAFYREIRQGHLRFGYYGVPRERETYFDSATNSGVLQRR